MQNESDNQEQDGLNEAGAEPMAASESPVPDSEAEELAIEPEEAGPAMSKGAIWKWPKVMALGLGALVLAGAALAWSQMQRTGSQEEAAPLAVAIPTVDPLLLMKQQCEQRLGQAKELVKPVLPPDMGNETTFAIEHCADLNQDQAADLILKAENGMAYGRHSYFFVLKSGPDDKLSLLPSEEMALWVDKVEILPSEHQGMADLKTLSGMSASEAEIRTLTWNGKSYAVAGNVTEYSNVSFTNDMFIGAENVNIRQEPSTSAKVLLKASLNSAIKASDITREADGYTWRMLQTPDGETGWAAESMLSQEKLLTGAFKPDEGLIFGDGRSVNLGQSIQGVKAVFGEPTDSQDLGRIKQYDFPLFSVLTLDDEVHLIRFGGTATLEAIQPLRYVKGPGGVTLGTPFAEVEKSQELFMEVKKDEAKGLEAAINQGFMRMMVGMYMNDKRTGFFVLKDPKLPEAMRQLWGMSIFSESMEQYLVLEMTGTLDRLRESGN